MNVNGYLCEFMGFLVAMGIYGFLGVYRYTYWCHESLWVLYLNVENIAHSSFKNPRRIENPRKRLKSHMCYKKWRICTTEERDFIGLCVFSTRLRLPLCTRLRLVLKTHTGLRLVLKTHTRQ